ncbi:hypothetical protein M9H77_08917 [Catharanthus roseus]|uniref:Uncharacterized protein n=1 Tax=Catharanthus roseus TaxID=4058 RepID=A0ACC0BZE8_CATRO|nr:hypothetical protein M9H77_08917 [Catharanthus roseus]
MDNTPSRLGNIPMTYSTRSERSYISPLIEDKDYIPYGVSTSQRINKYMPENEISLGCMSLKPSPEMNSKMLGKKIRLAQQICLLENHQSKYAAQILVAKFDKNKCNMDDIIVLKSKPLGICAKSIGKSGDNNLRHPMIIRLGV